MYLLAILPIFSVIKALLQSHLSRNEMKTSNDSVFYTAFMFLFASLILAVIFLRDIPLLEVLIYAGILSVAHSFYQILYTLALKNGPVASTNIIINFSSLIPILFGILFLGDTLSILGAFGIALILTAIVLIPSKKHGEKKANLKWAILAFMGSFFSGVAYSITLLFARSELADHNEVLVMCQFLFASIFSFALHGSIRLKTKQERFLKLKPINLGIIFVISIVLAFYNVLTTYSLTFIPSTIFYPVTSILTSSMILIADILIYKQKFTLNQILGLISGTIGIVLLNF